MLFFNPPHFESINLILATVYPSYDNFRNSKISAFLGFHKKANGAYSSLEGIK